MGATRPSTVSGAQRNPGARSVRRARRSLAALTAATLPLGSLTLVPTGAAAATQKAKGKGKGVLTVQEPGVTLLRKGASSFTTVKRKKKIATGDTVQTDATGLAEISFPDGSLTRLDHNTVFTLEQLTTKTGKRRVEGTVSAGQTWNRVQKLSESDSFEQKGNGATAAVLGTAFFTRCSLPAGVKFKPVKTKKALRKLRKASSCQFTLVDGRLVLTAAGTVLGIGRGQSVDVDTQGTPGDTETLPPDILFNDQWVVQNLAADARAGKAEAQGEPTLEDLKHARIEGSWPVTLTVLANNGFRDLAATRTRTYTFTGSCDGGVCTVTLTRETGAGIRVVPLRYSDGVYTGEDPDFATQDCVLDNQTVSVPGGLRNSSTITFSPSAAVANNGLWRATALSGVVTETATQVAGAPGQCQSGNATFGLSASR